MRPECPGRGRRVRVGLSGNELKFLPGRSNLWESTLKVFLIRSLISAHKVITEPEDWTPLFYYVCSPSFKEKNNPQKTVKMG